MTVMNSEEMIERLRSRSEDVLPLIREKYGAYCRYIAGQILGSPEDAEEVENDVMLKLWRTVPPASPTSLRSYLGMLSRQIAIDKRRAAEARMPKRDAYTESLDELAELLPEEAADSLTDTLALRQIFDRFLSQIGKKERRIFLLRYWYALSIREVSEEMNMSEGSIRMRLSRSREKLLSLLHEEDLWNG